MMGSHLSQPNDRRVRKDLRKTYRSDKASVLDRNEESTFFPKKGTGTEEERPLYKGKKRTAEWNPTLL